MPAVNTMFQAGLGSGTAPMSQYPQTPTVATGSNVGVTGNAGVMIDGTPLRVVTIVGLCVFGLVLFKWAGWKFNVTVGG